MSTRIVGSLVVVLALTGCKHVGFQRRPLDVQHADVKQASGLEYEDEFLGRGPAAAIGDSVLLDYTAQLVDGTPIDSTLDRGVPVLMEIGHALVRGLDEGLVGIRAEGRRKIRVPAELAYGAQGVEGLVPPNSALVFEVHAIEVHPKGEKSAH